MIETQILITIKQSKPISDLLDKAAGRIYTLDGVEDVTATLLSPEQVEQLQEKKQCEPSTKKSGTFSRALEAVRRWM